jgi:sorbitol-specific phosphotransferase system component IIC
VISNQSQRKYKIDAMLIELSYGIEIALVILWACWVGRAYLVLDPTLWPSGGEFPLTVQTHFNWINFKTCGPCMFWNGFSRGGAPAFAELQGSFLHPLVAFPTLLFGVVDGAKIALLLSLIVAGLAQWWLAKTIGAGRLARLFTAATAVIGGHLAGKMQLGAVGLVISTAACSLVLAPALELALHQRWRSASWLGIALGLAALAGQGYLQIGMLLCYVPAFLICLARRDWWRDHLWRKFAAAGVIAALIAGVLLVPLLHFGSNITKPLDFTFDSAQSLQYQPLNLVIHDYGFYLNTSLEKLALPNLTINYIGWLSVLLALLGTFLAPREKRRIVFFFVTAIALTWLASSGESFRFLVLLVPALAGVRFPSFIAGLVIPPLLGLAALGIEAVLQFIGFHVHTWFSIQRSRILAQYVLLLPVLGLMFFSLQDGYDFSQIFWQTEPESAALQSAALALKTDTAEWVDFIDPNLGFILPAAENGLKLSSAFRTWNWIDVTLPLAQRVASLDSVADDDPALTLRLPPYTILTYPQNEYATVSNANGVSKCYARAVGGNIDVVCTNLSAGVLTVQENTWQGWRVTVDGQAAELNSGSQWLQVAAPAGTHTYRFRYRPWDVPLGIGCSLLGWMLAGFFVCLRKKAKKNDQMLVK